jgi:hypothetical protein
VMAAEHRRINLPQNQQEAEHYDRGDERDHLAAPGQHHDEKNVDAQTGRQQELAARSKREATRRNGSLADFGSARR